MENMSSYYFTKKGIDINKYLNKAKSITGLALFPLVIEKVIGENIHTISNKETKIFFCSENLSIEPIIYSPTTYPYTLAIILAIMDKNKFGEKLTIKSSDFYLNIQLYQVLKNKFGYEVACFGEILTVKAKIKNRDKKGKEIMEPTEYYINEVFDSNYGLKNVTDSEWEWSLKKAHNEGKHDYNAFEVENPNNKEAGVEHFVSYKAHDGVYEIHHYRQGVGVGVKAMSGVKPNPRFISSALVIAKTIMDQGHVVRILAPSHNGLSDNYHSYARYLVKKFPQYAMSDKKVYTFDHKRGGDIEGFHIALKDKLTPIYQEPKQNRIININKAINFLHKLKNT